MRSWSDDVWAWTARAWMVDHIDRRHARANFEAPAALQLPLSSSWQFLGPCGRDDARPAEVCGVQLIRCLQAAAIIQFSFKFRIWMSGTSCPTHLHSHGFTAMFAADPAYSPATILYAVTRDS